MRNRSVFLLLGFVGMLVGIMLAGCGSKDSNAENPASSNANSSTSGSSQTSGSTPTGSNLSPSTQRIVDQAKKQD